MEPEILEGKLESLPRAAGELSWIEVWMLTVIVTCAYLVCILLAHAAMLRS